LLLLAPALLVGALVGRNAAEPREHDGDTFADAALGERRPRLVVLISVDQLRADYLARFSDLFAPARRVDGKPGGFRFLMEEGSWFVDARYPCFPLFTGPGHAAISTGGPPAKTGVIGNDWFDRASHKVVYCVDDERARVIGTAGKRARPMGPRNL